jgi:hypothetical protein
MLRPAALAAILTTATALAFAACSSNSDATSGAGGAGATGGAGGHLQNDAGKGGGGGDLFGDGGLGDGGTDDCSAAAKLIYLFTSSGADGDGGLTPARLYSLEPLSKKLTLIGGLGTNLGATGLSPVGITILRDGLSAYVSDAAHSLRRVSLSDGTADAMPLLDFVAAGGKTSDNYTVALVGDGKGNDQLYAEGYSRTFYKVDVANKKLTTIGAMDRLCDLTGTNDSRLFGFCDDTSIRQLDPASGAAITSDPAPGWKSTWAIAFWGGYYWLFFGDTMTPSELYRYDPVAKTSMLWMTAAELGGIRVPGAGVSTCAPLEIPK